MPPIVKELDAVSPLSGDFSALARRILREVPLIDGHNDFPWMVRGWFKNQASSPDFDIREMPIGQTDLTSLTQAQLGGQFWSAFVPCPTKTDDWSDSTLLDTLRMSLQQIDLIHILIDKFPKQLGLVEKSDDILKIFRSGRIASLIGIEGLHQIGNSASISRMYHRLGVRYITLCHNSNNMYADAAPCATQPHGGLSAAGRELLVEMNRIGMMIDLSHTSDSTQRQALMISKAPVIFSHSSCYALRPHPRNVSDEVLRMLRENGGLIMICFLPSLVGADDGKSATLGHVVDHIIYAADLIGYGHVGIGSDFDGMLEGPSGLDDTSCYPQLIAELLRRGVSEENVKKVIGLNIIRVLEDVERYSRMAKLEGVDVLCDEVGDVWTPEQRAILVARGTLRKKDKNVSIS